MAERTTTRTTVKLPTDDASISRGLKNLEEKSKIIKENLSKKGKELQIEEKRLEIKKHVVIQNRKERSTLEEKLMYETTQKNIILKNIQDGKSLIDNITPRVIQVGATLKQSQNYLAIIEPMCGQQEKNYNEVISTHENKYKTLKNKLSGVQHEAAVFAEQHESKTIQINKDHSKVLHDLNKLENLLSKQKCDQEQFKTTMKMCSNQICLEKEQRLNLQNTLDEKKKCKQELLSNVSFKKRQLEAIKENHFYKSNDTVSKLREEEKKSEVLETDIEKQILCNKNLHEGLQNDVLSSLNLEGKSITLIYSTLQKNLEQKTEELNCDVFAKTEEVEKLKMAANKEDNILSKINEDFVNVTWQRDELVKTIAAKKDNVEILNSQIDSLNFFANTKDEKQKCMLQWLENNKLDALKKQMEVNQNKISNVISNQDEIKLNFEKFLVEKEEEKKLIQLEFDSIHREHLNDSNKNIVLQTEKAEMENKSEQTKNAIVSVTNRIEILNKQLEKLNIEFNSLKNAKENIEPKPVSETWEFAFPKPRVAKRRVDGLSDTSSDSLMTLIRKKKAKVLSKTAKKK